MDTVQQKGIIALIKSAITNNSYELPQEFDFESAIEYGKKSKICGMMYYGAINCGISQNSEAMQKLFVLTCMSISLNEQQMFEYDKICKIFDKNNIAYMPLKGVLLKQIYPKSDMRTMSDIDILIKVEQYDNIKPLLLDLGYTEKEESNHELPWLKDKIYLELHKRIISTYNKDFYQYYGEGWSFAHPTSENSNRYEMKSEDLFIYLFTHLTKHYRSGGIGIKHMTDLWVYLKANSSMDKSYIEKQLHKLKLLEFYRNILFTLNVWFADAKSTDITDFITQVIFKSGAYGSHEDRIAALMIRSRKTTGQKKNIRTREVFRTIFLPYRYMCGKYPILKRIPILLPFMWCVRGISVFCFSSHKIKKLGEDVKLMSDDKVDYYYQSLKFVGLDYYYGE